MKKSSTKRKHTSVSVIQRTDDRRVPALYHKEFITRTEVLIYLKINYTFHKIQYLVILFQNFRFNEKTV